MGKVLSENRNRFTIRATKGRRRSVSVTECSKASRRCSSKAALMRHGVLRSAFQRRSAGFPSISTLICGWKPAGASAPSVTVKTSNSIRWPTSTVWARRAFHSSYRRRLSLEASPFSWRISACRSPKFPSTSSGCSVPGSHQTRLCVPCWGRWSPGLIEDSSNRSSSETTVLSPNFGQPGADCGRRRRSAAG